MKKILGMLIVVSFATQISAATVKTTPKSTSTPMLKPEPQKLEVPSEVKNNPLYSRYLKEIKSKQAIETLKKETLEQKQKAVPLLTYVMKTKDFPDNNRWIATFLLGQIMGVKSAPFISKFAFHPNWMLRLASLKTLLALKQNQYKGIYTRLLKDDAMIVRLQALENIRLLKLDDLAPYVWAMLYDKRNYSNSEGQHKRGNIIKIAIKTMGDLGFKESQKPMLAMIQNKKYKDIYEELDYSLSKVSNKPSPSGSIEIKKHYWTKLATAEKTI
jgi:hypothetical protein